VAFARASPSIHTNLYSTGKPESRIKKEEEENLIQE
jgi:hypothetical protein